MGLPDSAWLENLAPMALWVTVAYLGIALRSKRAPEASQQETRDRDAERRARRWRHWASLREWSLSGGGRVLTGRIEPFSATLRLGLERRAELELQGTVSFGAPRVCRRGDDAAFDAMFDAARVSRIDVMNRGLVLVFDTIEPEDMEELLEPIDRFARAHTGGYRG